MKPVTSAPIHHTAWPTNQQLQQDLSLVDRAAPFEDDHIV
jgi:hypothetical protein